MAFNTTLVQRHLILGRVRALERKMKLALLAASNIDRDSLTTAQSKAQVDRESLQQHLLLGTVVYFETHRLFNIVEAPGSSKAGEQYDITTSEDLVSSRAPYEATTSPAAAADGTDEHTVHTVVGCQTANEYTLCQASLFNRAAGSSVLMKTMSSHQARLSTLNLVSPAASLVTLPRCLISKSRTLLNERSASFSGP